MSERPEIKKRISIWFPMKPDRLYESLPMKETIQSVMIAIDTFLQKYPDVIVHQPDRAYNSDTVAARSEIVSKFRGTHLLMIDGDQQLYADTIIKLYDACEEGRDIVLAPSVRINPPYEPTFGFWGHDGKFRTAVLDYDYDMQDVEANRIIEIDGGGFPAVMFRREVFDEMPPEIFGPHFNRIHHAVERDSTYGHDLSFCMRAKAAGLKIYCHMGCKVPHFTSKGFIWLEYHDQLVHYNPQMRQFFEPFIKANNLKPREQQRIEDIETAQKEKEREVA